jgi:murein DD-endopeptidase MepM/ murein hydrolase activator NlpD
MKLFQDYKREFKFLFIGTLLVLPMVFSFAQTAQEINDKIDEKNADIAKIEQEIKAYQNELNSLGQQKTSLANSLKELEITRKKLSADMSVTQAKIDKTNLKIRSLGSQIVNKEESIANGNEAIKLDLKKSSEYEDYTIAEILLSKDNFTDIWNDVDSIITVRKKIINTINELRNIKTELEDTRDETIVARTELESLKQKLADQKKIVDQNTAEKNKLLAQTKNNEANYQALVADRLAKKDALEKEIDSYESQLKYILDASKLPGKGSLSWPVDSVYVTSYFGPRWGKIHNGIDLRAAVGTPVKAAADGVVAGVGDTDQTCAGASFGKFILIKYNNGLATTYGHMSLTKVSKGQKVSRGQIVGYSGNTGYSTGPHLHISVYPKDGVDVKSLPSKSCPGKTLTQPIAATNAYLDPAKYFPKL